MKQNMVVAIGNAMTEVRNDLGLSLHIDEIDNPVKELYDSYTLPPLRLLINSLGNKSDYKFQYNNRFIEFNDDLKLNPNYIILLHYVCMLKLRNLLPRTEFKYPTWYSYYNDIVTAIAHRYASYGGTISNPVDTIRLNIPNSYLLYYEDNRLELSELASKHLGIDTGLLENSAFMKNTRFNESTMRSYEKMLEYNNDPEKIALARILLCNGDLHDKKYMDKLLTIIRKDNKTWKNECDIRLDIKDHKYYYNTFIRGKDGN